MRGQIADRKEGFLEILQSYLWDRGFVAEIAGDGHPCAASVDLHRGGAGGFLAQMCENPILSERPVILMANEVLREAGARLPESSLGRRIRKALWLCDLPFHVRAVEHPGLEATQRWNSLATHT